MMQFIVKKFKGWLISGYISFFMGMKKFEDELKADPIDLFKTEQRAEVRDMMKMFDENYIQQFYEILKKADKFLRSANPAKIQKTAGKFGLNYGIKDRFGRRHEHYGFFDEKHEHYGKSLNEVRDLEVSERKLDDDNYPVIVMYENKKEFSLLDSARILLDNDNILHAPEIHEMARMKNYPLLVVRDKEVANRIEQLTEFLHVKQISSMHKILEFFIPAKFGLSEISEDDPIFKEIIAIKQVWFKDEYGDKNSYSITKYHKRGEYNKYTEVGNLNPSGFDIIKFHATDIVEVSKM